MKVKVFVTLKDGVLDPQGQATVKALKNNNINGINSVRQGKFFELDVEEKNAEAQVKEACEKLLANTVIEDYSFEMVS